ncbi:MAG: glycosyl transferase family [Bacteroidetes bacterium]|nr:glycosyl transferase family [Bacteroidota bacterium]
MNSVPLISIIIPCFNAEKFIADTLQSVLRQTYTNVEVICINDGSTDNSEAIISSINDQRIHYFYKKNTGVSDSRNQGLKKAKGEYILFLDADDLLSEQFVEKSIDALQQNNTVGFCSSKVIKIDETGKALSANQWKGASGDILQEVLSYNPDIVTCPSNYVFRKKILVDNSVFFNTSLSSSADRYFLIELANYTKGMLITDGNYLYYRVHKTSMSNNFTPGLLNDNLLFQKEVLKIGNIPGRLKREFNFKTNYIFAGSSFRLKQYGPCIGFSVKAFYYNPLGFIKQLIIKN